MEKGSVEVATTSSVGAVRRRSCTTSTVAGVLGRPFQSSSSMCRFSSRHVSEPGAWNQLCRQPRRSEVIAQRDTATDGPLTLRAAGCAICSRQHSWRRSPVCAAAVRIRVAACGLAHYTVASYPAPLKRAGDGRGADSCLLLPPQHHCCSSVASRCAASVRAPAHSSCQTAT